MTSETIYALPLGHAYSCRMTPYEKIDQAFARSCFRQAKKLMNSLVQHYQQTEAPTETIQELNRQIRWAMLCKKNMSSHYTPQRILMLRAKRYVLRRRPAVPFPETIH
ncbi:MAG: hypothetical protein KUG61_00790 [Parvibaculaceae bacterium]|nr:hypothetical protein [Parvibaculaceae bacterium]